MLQITIELKNSADEMLILPLLQRLGIQYSALNKKELDDESLAYHLNIIEQGVDIPDFDEFLAEFNNSRQDKSYIENLLPTLSTEIK